MLRLYNGVEIPKLGLGAKEIYSLDEYKKEYEFYCYAIEKGCCLFDTSAAYGRNDEALGQAIFDSGKRNRIGLMTKISNPQQKSDDIRRECEAHLRYLKTDYVDYYLLHWPQPGTYIKAYQALEKLYEEGLVRAIGVSNFNIHHLKELAMCTNIKPMINQFEITPQLTQDALVNYCKAFDIMPVAYSALGEMSDNLHYAEPIRYLAKKYNKTTAQIILKWNEQLERPALTTTRNKGHFMESFIDNVGYELEKREIFWINSVNDNIRVRFNPDTVDFSVN
jgi:methylglyoxal/glyoxal reductase